MYNKKSDGNGTETAVEELTWEFLEDGMMSRRQLAKHVLDLNGCWLVVAYLYQDLNRKKGIFEKPKVAFVRYRRYGERYKKMGQFNLSLTQVMTAMPVLGGWLQKADEMVEAIDGPAPADPRPASAAAPRAAAASAAPQASPAAAD